jgi:hypothetical protein
MSKVKIEKIKKPELLKRIADNSGLSAVVVGKVLASLKDVSLEVLAENKSVSVVPELVTLTPKFTPANSGVTLGKSWSKPDRVVVKSAISKKYKEMQK